MATVLKGVITWRGDTGRGRSKYARSTIMDVTADAAMQTLATALTSHTDCNKAAAGFITKTSGDDSAPAASADTGLKGTVYFRNEADLRVRSVTFSAPVAADIEDVGYGKAYKAASVTTIVALIATATGLTLTPLYGTVEDDIGAVP
ncbi:MAG: hypothetical protein V3V31_03780 [Methylococcales bacterium]